MIRYNICCDQCQKNVKDSSLTWFSDNKKNINFCSEECYLIWKKWENIHPDFTVQLKNKWENKGFNYEECKEWIDNNNLKPNEYEFATHLRTEKYINSIILMSSTSVDLSKSWGKIIQNNYVLPEQKDHHIYQVEQPTTNI